MTSERTAHLGVRNSLPVRSRAGPPNKREPEKTKRPRTQRLAGWQSEIRSCQDARTGDISQGTPGTERGYYRRMCGVRQWSSS